MPSSSRLSPPPTYIPLLLSNPSSPHSFHLFASVVRSARLGDLYPGRLPRPFHGMGSRPKSDSAAPAGTGYIGFISAHASIIHAASDVDSIADRLLESVRGHCFATQCFSLQADAVCWLTDPWRAAALIDGDKDIATSSSVGCGPELTWLATLTMSSRSCVQLDRAGVRLALSLIANPAVGTCVIGRFYTDQEAWSWLGSDIARSLLDVVDAAAPADGLSVGGDIQADPLSAGGAPVAPPQEPDAAVEARAPVVSNLDTHLHVGDLGSLPGVSWASATSTTPAAVCGARQAPTARGTTTRLSHSRHTSTGDVPWRRTFRAEATRGKSGRVEGWAAVDGSSPAVGSLTFRPLRKRVVSSLYGLDAFMGSDNVSTPVVRSLPVTPGSPTLASPTASAELSSSGRKRSRPHPTVGDEPSGLLNPRFSAKEPYHGILSMAEIKKSMAHSRAVWEQQDLLDACAKADTARQSGSAAPANASAGVVTAGPLSSSKVMRGGTCVVDHLSAKSHTTAPTGTSSVVPSCASSLAVTAVTPALASPAETPQCSLNDASSPDVDGVVSEPRAIGRLAANGDWDGVCAKLWARRRSALVSGGPGTGKSTLLKRFHAFMSARLGAGAVVVVAPTGTAAKTADGMTCHSFFGFERGYDAAGADPAAEAARLLRTARFGPIKKRLLRTRVVLLDEISLVSAEKLDVMYELMVHARPASSPAVLWFLFGDFLQLMPVEGTVAFKAKCWPAFIGNNFLELSVVHRQEEPDLVQAVQDVRVGVCSPTVLAVMKERQVGGREYEAVQDKVLHLMPRLEDVTSHNRSCLFRLGGEDGVRTSMATDSTRLDPNRDPNLHIDAAVMVTAATKRAALVDCVAPPSVSHSLHARVMLLDNRRRVLGLCHGSVGTITSYLPCGTPVVRFENNPLPLGVCVQGLGVHDAGDTWIEVECPAVDFTARILSKPGMLAVRTQVPFVLGWAATVHMSQSLTLSEVVVDLARAFGPGMVLSAMSRVCKKQNLYVKSFCPSRVYAAPLALEMYRTWDRL